MTRILCRTKDMSHDEWLKARRLGIGGSDAAAVVGMSRYRSPIEVFLDKTDDDRLPEVEDNDKMWVGRMLEATIAEMWEEKTGKKCARRNAILQHDDHDWMLANIDRWVVGENAGLEIKTGSSYVMDDWKGGSIPTEYELQCLHYMAVTGADRWYIAALIGNDFVLRTIERDEDTIKYLINVEQDFWMHNVCEKIMPPPDGSDASAKALKLVYPEAEEGITVDLDDLQDTLARLIDVKQLVKKLKAEMSELEQTIQGRMGNAEAAWIGTRQVTWKNRQGRVSVDVDALKENEPSVFEKYKKQGKPYRVFTIGKKVGGK